MSKFIEPSAAGPTMKIKDGVVGPPAHKAQEGSVSNPGVRTVSTATVGPRCPKCGEASLKMRMNKKAGSRVYCSKSNCDYDQSTSEQSIEGGIKPNQNVRVVTNNNPSGQERGVKILRQNRLG